MSDPNDGCFRVAVIGLGYIGSVTAACLAHLGHSVIGVDRDEFKVSSINAGKAPFLEPGLDELAAAGAASGRLSASTSLEPALRDADIALICVGTPSEKNGNLGLVQLRRVVAEIAACPPRPAPREPLIIAVRSTVFPGTCEEELLPALKDSRAIVVSHPEFLREGTAVHDFMEPSLIVVGGSDSAAVAKVAALYRSLPLQPCLVSMRTAEMIKYACNAFHALKISFANEIGTLAAQLGVSGEEVMQTLCTDTKLNVSKAYLRPGFAFGGSCLPKDLRALTYRAARLDLKLPLLTSVLPSNEEHLERAIEAVLAHPGRRIGVFGLTFKEDTDDLRESPNVALLEHLLGKGREVRVFDPQIQLDAIYGANRDFLFTSIPHIQRILEPAFDTLAGWCDFMVIAQTPKRPYSADLANLSKPVLDLTRFALDRPQ